MESFESFLRPCWQQRKRDYSVVLVLLAVRQQILCAISRNHDFYMLRAGSRAGAYSKGRCTAA